MGDQNNTNNKSANIKVLKNLNEVKNGFYLVVDIIKEAKPRDELIIKLMDNGHLNTSFFYDFNIFSYYVYTKYAANLNLILKEYQDQEKKPNFDKVIIVEIRNE